MRPEAANGQFVPCRLNEGQPLPFLYQANGAVSAALASLYRAYQYSLHARTDRWQFAVKTEELFRLGLTKSDLRWLVATGLARHARKVADPANQTGRLVESGMQPIVASSCFVLSDNGVKSIYRKLNRKSRTNIVIALAAPKERASGVSAVNQQSIPHWFPQRRELHLQGLVVKQFRGPAANQEWIIRVFHEEKWPVRIDDPLPPAGDQDPRRRLNDTIKNLNRHQRHQLICFRGDGTGKGILWELRDEALSLGLDNL